MSLIKSTVFYVALAYVALVISEGLFYAYLGYQYATHPALQETEQRRKEDTKRKREFLKQNPEYSGLLTSGLFERGGAAAHIVRRHSFLPLGHGLPNTPLIYCNEGYGFLKYRTDRYGLHNDNAVWEGERPWLLIGDSFAHGACVPTEHNIASRLMNASGASVINVGSAGNGPNRYVALARVFIPLTKPGKVVLVFYENDFDAAAGSIYVSQTRLFAPYFGNDFQEDSKAFYAELKRFMDREKKRYISSGENDWSRKLSKIADKLVGAASRILLLEDLRNVLWRNAESFNYARLAIETVAQECSKLTPECDVVVVYIPPSADMRPRPQGFIQEQATYLRNAIAQIETPIAFVDLSRSLDRAMYAPKGAHLSIEGYGLVADRIMSAAREHAPRPQ